MKSCAVEKKDIPRLHDHLLGLDISNIIAKEFAYHQTCYTNYTRPPKRKIEKLTDFSNLFTFVKTRIIENGEVLEIGEIMKLWSYDDIVDVRTIKQKLVDEFGTDIGFWSPRSGKSLVFSELIPKGQIIEVGSSRLKAANSLLSETSLRDKVREVAKTIREEVKEIESIFTSWPPTEQELYNCEVHLPPLLKLFLSSLLSCKPKLSKNKEASVNSLGQDIIFKVTNGRQKPLKHVLLSLSTKRKTGSKQMIKWLNRLGHGISYDDVNYLETGLAESQMLRKSLRTFVPSTVEPSKFITFIWDNNDINPETLTGISIHCTNGIIVQLRSEHSTCSDVPDFTVRNRDKKRSFKGVQSELQPYFVSKRHEPQSFLDVETNSISDHSISSKYIDFVWILLKSVFSTSIPNWTGFNYLITPEIIESYHEVSYLPAIDKSPTSYDTVLEVLKQSKEKAEVLGLTETDIVMDQATYEKAVDILVNPVNAELNDFIVLRMGAFHTSCIFITVIGKRFADAGLRDLIIEANLVGN